MTDDEILTGPSELLFPGKGRVVIDTITERRVYYRRWPDGEDMQREYRDRRDFCDAVRRAWGE